MRNRYGSIVKRGDHLYEISYEGHRNKDGTRNRSSKMVRGALVDAERELVVFRVSNGEVPRDGDGDMLTGDYFEKIWLPGLSVRPSTLNGYQQVVKSKILPDPVAMVPLSSLTSRRIRMWLSQFKTRGVFDDFWSTFRAGINCAVDEYDLIEINPLPRRVKHPPKPAPPFEVLSAEDVSKVLDAAKGEMVEPVTICSPMSWTSPRRSVRAVLGGRERIWTGHNR